MSEINEENIIKPSLENQQYVTFKLEDELYGFNVMKSQEVMSMTRIERVPDTQAYMMGVIDLRGLIVPIVDLRKKYGLRDKTYDDDTAIIIVETHGELVGLIVDSVVDVMQLSLEEVQDTLHFTIKSDNDSVQGIGKVNDRIIIILDIEKILSKEEMKGVVQEK